MTRDDIIQMAREAELHCHVKLTENGLFTEDLEYFAKLIYEHTWKEAGIAATKTVIDAAVLDEREQCARVCEEHWRFNGSASECADAIRARGDK